MQKDPNTILTRAGVSRHLGIHIKQSLEPHEDMPSLCKHHLDTADAKRPKHHLDTSRKPPTTASQKTVSRYLWNPHKTIFGATEHMPSLCKHHLDTADAKRPKHHLDTSRKPPKPQAKKLFHVTFGIHIKQSKTATEHNLWSHRAHAQKHHVDTADAKDLNTIWTRAENRPNRKPKKTLSRHLWKPHKTSKTIHAQPMQTPSGHCRCKKTQTPSRHEPKTAQTASQKTVSRYLWKPHK